MRILNIPKCIYLYNEGAKGIDFEKLRDFILKTFGSIRVVLIKLENKVVATDGLIFNFIATQENFSTLPYSKIKDACHIILTDKLFATYDQEKKLHLRAAVYSYPSVISTSGIVEGPAKPKEYYLYKQKFTQLGIWNIEETRVKKKFQGRFIDYKDRRMSEVLKGYIAQVLFFYITGEPFCSLKRCRLFNAHWQEDLIYSQIKAGLFCPRHKKLLERIKDFT